MKNKEKALSFTLLTVLAVTVCAPKARAQQYNPESDFNTELINNGREIKITEYIGFSYDLNNRMVRIPPRIQRLPVTCIGKWAFNNSNSDTLEGIVLPDSVTIIENGAFSGCTNLSWINIPDGVTTIEEYAFSQCSNLTGMDIPKSVTSIVNGAFDRCTSLEAISVAAGNPSYSSQDGVLYNKNKSILIQFPGGKTGTFIVPNSVRIIRDWAFRYSSVTRVNMSNSVGNIGDYAFAESGLISIILPNSIILIRPGTFQGCVDLINISIPNSVTGIGEYAFQGCGLAQITLPAGIAKIEAYAFSECDNLTSVTFEGTIPPDELNNHAFEGIGDLREKYLARGPGRYTRTNGSSRTWTKQ